MSVYMCGLCVIVLFIGVCAFGFYVCMVCVGCVVGGVMCMCMVCMCCVFVVFVCVRM
jgi:hypothetical protein